MPSHDASSHPGARGNWLVRTVGAIAEFFGIRNPKSAWRERALARIGYLEAQAKVEACRPETAGSCERQARISGMRDHLHSAQKAARQRYARRLWSGAAALERTWANVRAAELILLELIPDQELLGRSGHVQFLAMRYLAADDPRRIELAEKLKCGGKLTAADREIMVRVVEAAYAGLDAEYARVRSLRNMLWVTTVVVFAAVAGLAVFGLLAPRTVSLCFMPQVNRQTIIVCPSKEFRDPTRQQIADPTLVASSMDVLVVEMVGLAGAALTVIASLRRIPGTSGPFMLPLASAVLKLPTGALSAFLGVLLIRGAFIPGLTNLDSSGQVLAWGILFGAAQHVVTRLVDDRAQSTLYGDAKQRPDPDRGAAETD